MIVPPRRSVTRFFIPLIDVLILLFAIFLLMPFVSGSTSAEISGDVKASSEKPLPTDVKVLQDMLKEEQLRVDRLEKERRARLTDRLAVRVLEIDRTSYLDSRLAEPGPGFADIVDLLCGLVRRLGAEVASLGAGRDGAGGWAQAAE